MSFSTSPNMQLPIPGVGTEAGPDYALDVNASLTLIDQHDHSPGRGVQITPAGMNINAALSLANNQLINVQSTVFQSQTAVSSVQTLYVAPGTESPVTQDLWFNDGNGVPVQITSGGTVNATIASIPGESYSAGTFFWKQGAGSTVPANFDIGSITLRPNSAATAFGITLSPPGSIASAYNIVLPALPASTSFMAIDNSGNITTPLAVNSPTYLQPTAAVIMFAGSSAPVGWLLCDGSEVSRTTYADLFAIISISYGAGNGTTTFNLPNTQGIFVRGNGSQTISGQVYTGSLASKEIDNFEAHQHEISYTNGNSHFGQGSTALNAPNGAFSFTTNVNGIAQLSGITGVGTETKPANIALNYIIKT